MVIKFLLPKGLEKLTSLEELGLRKNKISELSGLSSLKQLKILSLGDNPIAEKIDLENTPIKELINN